MTHKSKATLKEELLKEIHKMYLDGESYVTISGKLGIPLGRVHATVLKQRALNPIDWPKRVDESVKRTMGFQLSDNIVVVFRYECTSCAIYFNVEMSGEMLELRTACPTCQDDEGVNKIGVGYMFDDTFSIPSRKKKDGKTPEQEKALSKARAKAKELLDSDQPRTWTKVPYTDEERAFICYMNDKLRNKEIGALLNRSKTSIDKQVIKMRKEETFEHYFRLGEELYKEGILMNVI